MIKIAIYPVTVLVFFALLLPISVSACDFDDFPVEPTMTIYPILDNTVHNNRVITTKGFSAESSMSEIKRYYSRRWNDRIAESLAGPWIQISTMKGDCLFTVQMANAPTGSQGRLVMSPAPTQSIGNGNNLGEGLVVPQNSIVVTDTKMDDGPKIGRVSMLASDMSPARVGRFYRSEMLGNGWSLEHEFSEQDSEVLIFRDGTTTSNVLIIPAGDITQILISTEEIK